MRRLVRWGSARHESQRHDREVRQDMHKRRHIPLVVQEAREPRLILAVRTVDDKDDLSDAERTKLHAAIEQSLAEIEAGQTVPFADLNASLRAKRVTRPVR